MKTLAKLVKSVLKTNIEIMVEAIETAISEISEIAVEFMLAPASTKYHQNYAGGLFEHSVLMATWLFSRTATCGGPLDLTARQCARIGIFHDLCKVGLYTMNPDGTWGKDDEISQHHSKRSLEILENLHVSLDDVERIGIILHMAGGWWNEEDENLLSEEDRDWLKYNLQFISAVQWADMKAC